jgi:copper-containing nitrite reductase
MAFRRVGSATKWRIPLANRKALPHTYFAPLQISTRRLWTYDSSKIRRANIAPLGILAALGVVVSETLLYLNSSAGKSRSESAAQQQEPSEDYVYFAFAKQNDADYGRDSYKVKDKLPDISKLPRERAKLTSAPEVPPPIERDYPVLLEVPLVTTTKTAQLTSQYKYDMWTFNGTVPGPFIRARVGDVVELTLTNKDVSGNPHNIDSHAFTGPGGGAALTTTEENETTTARFRLLYPGLYLYHCAAGPVPVHIANGMYGLMYVQPAEGDLPPVNREYYVMQSEFYHEPPEVENGRPSSQVEFSYPNALREEPDVIVFNGSDAALTRDKPLKAHVGETVRIFFGNAGPNLTSSFHIIGSHFTKVYRDGSVVDPPSRFIGTISVPPGGAAITDLKMVVPGTYTLVDHAIFRLEKGAVGFLNVSGKPRPDIYQSTEPSKPCVGCKLHA